MSRYKKTFEPTKDGFQEVWDSMQDPTIEQLMAGIQAHRPTREQLLEKIRYFRNSRSTIDIELNRLADYSEDYNELWAAKNIYHFGTTEALQNRTKSQCKRWAEMLELTSPRFNRKAAPQGVEQSVYKASYLTKKPLELDIWGPASYGTIIYDLKEELDYIISHLEDGEQLCKDTLAREEEIDSDPEQKKQLYERQYREEEERNQETIDEYCNDGNISDRNTLYQKMLEYDDRNDFINDNFHGPSTSQFSRFVVVDATMNALKRNVSPVARRLLGNDINKILQVNHAIDHLDQLLDVKPGGQFDPVSIVQCIRWCGILPSTKKRRDNERVFYEEYLMPNYPGTHTWPAWNTVFTRRKTMGNEEHQIKLDAASFDKKFREVCGKNDT
jgi:hypothetical protein